MRKTLLTGCALGALLATLPTAADAQSYRGASTVLAGNAGISHAPSGGPGLPEGVNRGYFVRPTVFADVGNDMTIAQQEIFGPVLSIIPFDTEDEAVAIANDTPYGLTNYVQSQDGAKRNRVARR